MSGRLIAMVGPSGVGKDTVMEAMVASEPRLTLVRRVITRPTQAGGEVFDGVTVPVFKAMRDAGEFALWWSAHALYYGVPATVDADLAAGRDLLATLSRGLLAKAQARFPGFVVISLTASPDVLAERRARRGREDHAQIARRLARAATGVSEHIGAIEIDNSGRLDDTVQSALNALYPVRG